MSRGHGSLFRPKVRGTLTAIWWLSYYVGGSRFRESSHTTKKSEALRMLRDKLHARENGKVVGDPHKTGLTMLRDCLKAHYARENNRSWVRAEQAWAHLEQHFGPKATALSITRAAMLAYVDARLAAGAKANTVRYEVGVMSAAFGAAVDAELLAVRPVFKQPAEGDPREGYFSEGEIAALLVELPERLRGVTRFAHLTAWRLNECLGLMWSDVHWERGAIELSRSNAKGKKARWVPFDLLPGLRDLLEERQRVQDGAFVFHHRGQRQVAEGAFYKDWRAACTRAGMPGRHFHDLRRTAVVDMEVGGRLNRDEIKAIGGWSTDSCYTRYNVIDTARLERRARQMTGAPKTNERQTPPVPDASAAS